MADAAVEALCARLTGLGVEAASDASGEMRCRVGADGAREVLRQLQADAETPMRRLVDLTAVDFGGEPRFQLVYVLHAPGANLRLRLHVPVEGDPPTVESVTWLWPAAEWLEREVFDLFGIRFQGHPNLRRILLSEDFEGAPLRKDYPLRPDLGLPGEVER